MWRQGRAGAWRRGEPGPRDPELSTQAWGHMMVGRPPPLHHQPTTTKTCSLNGCGCAFILHTANQPQVSASTDKCLCRLVAWLVVIRGVRWLAEAGAWRGRVGRGGPQSASPCSAVTEALRARPAIPPHPHTQQDGSLFLRSRQPGSEHGRGQAG